MLNEKEVKIYCLCHHSFSGLPVSGAAAIMNLTPRRIEQILNSVQAKAPQLFPILTRNQARDYHLYADEGWTLKQIADDTGRDTSNIHKSVLAAIAKGMPKPVTRSQRVLSYDKLMDRYVKEKF